MVVYHVEPHVTGSWKVKIESAELALRTFDSKTEAVEVAKHLAKGKDQSRVIIHKKDGSVQNAHSYGGR